MRRTPFVVASLVALGSLAGCISERTSGPGPSLEGCNVDLPPEAFGSNIVVIRDFTFEPAQVSVRQGSKVTWVNCGAPGTDAHTSTADAGQWGSQLIAPGGTFTREFTATGSFPYHCEPHPGMRGSVSVQ